MRNRMIGRLLTLLACALVSERAWAQPAAEQVLREFPGEHEVVGQSRDVTTKTILDLGEPGISAHRYEIRGQVQHEDIEGSAQLEMWSHFPDGKRHFTRTVEMNGPMRMLIGTSGPRPFILPFESKSGALPVELIVNVVLPGKGTVRVSGMKLVQINDSSRLAAWWDGRTSGWVGGILGTLVGLLGASIGMLNTWHRSRPAAFVTAVFAAVISVALLVGGVVALSIGQPYHVWYPLLLCGAIGTFVLGGSIWVIRRNQAEHELRRMSAMDVPR